MLLIFQYVNMFFIAVHHSYLPLIIVFYRLSLIVTAHPFRAFFVLFTNIHLSYQSLINHFKKNVMKNLILSEIFIKVLGLVLILASALYLIVYITLVK